MKHMVMVSNMTNNGTNILDGGYQDAAKLIMGQLLSNPLFSGGALLSIAGFLMYLINWAWSFGYGLFRQRFFTTLHLTNENMTYKWVIDHINQNSKWETQNLEVNTTLNQKETGASRLSHKLIPGLGSHYFYYKNRVIYFQRALERGEHAIVRNEQGTREQKIMESIVLSTFCGSPEFWKQFLDDASTAYLKALDKGLTIYACVSSMSWGVSGDLRNKRPLETVILDDGIAEKICADIETFNSSEKWYLDRGIPYRRGYLLYGPPGTGKSSFIAALASHFGYGIATLNLSCQNLYDSYLQTLINNTPPKTFLLLEDIDVAFKKRETGEKETQSSCAITLSGLLNAIDGIASAEKRILFMTTNFKENLDGALIRSGRVDLQIELGNYTPSMTKKMFQRFYEKNVSEEIVQEFCEASSKLEKPFSPAQLQKHLIVYKDSPKAAIENVHELQ
uniref:Mitochondrial chaperone BCS1 n=1 Tax=Panagrolaimus davidi TaxID=227884 RepID=A0A914PYH8_9BILA